MAAVGALTTLDHNFKAFLEIDVKNYEGEWLALKAKEIIAHGKNLKEVYATAGTQYKSAELLFVRVPEKGVHIL